MRSTVVLLLLVAFASAAPAAEDADEQNILQLIQNAHPYENDILDNDDIVLPKTIDKENEGQEEDDKEIISTTEYTIESKSEISTDSPLEIVTQSDAGSEIGSDSKDISKVESMPAEQSNNATNIDSMVEKEQELDPGLDIEIVDEPSVSIEVEDTQFGEEFGPMIIESPKYSIKFPEVIPELESTSSDETSIEDGLYNNEEWPQRYAPDYPALAETPQIKETITNMEDVPQVPINTFGNQAPPEGYFPVIYGSDSFGPIGQADQIYNEQSPGQFSDIVPVVDAWSNTYPDPETYNTNPEVNQFGGDGIPYENIDDITIEPIYFDQVPKYYDDTPESSLNEEPPLEMVLEPDVVANSNENSNDGIELIVIAEEMSELPFTPIAEEVEQPQDSPIIPTAILQDTRPEVELLGLFDDSKESIIIEEEMGEMPLIPIAEEVEQPQDSPIIPTAILQDTRPEVDLLGLFGDSGEAVVIEEKTYPQDEDFVEEYLPASEASPEGIFDQGDVIIENSNISGTEDEAVLNPYGMLPPLNGDFEQTIVPEVSLLQEPTITVIEDDQFLLNKNDDQRIYFENEVRENLHIFPQTPQSNPNFMVPQIHEQFSSGNEYYQPNFYNRNINDRGDIPYTHNHGDFQHTHIHGDVPHTHNEQQFNFDNAPQNYNFGDISGSRKRDGTHIVPDMDNMEMPISEMGDMEIYDSPMTGPINPSGSPQITVILVSKPQEVSRIWSQFMRPMQQKPFSPVEITQIQDNLKEIEEISQIQHRFENEILGNSPNPFDNMGQFPQRPNPDQFNQNYYGQNFNQQPMQNYNSYQNMNSPQNQMFNSGMNPFAPNFNQQPNMGSMFPNLDMDLSFEDLEFIPLEDMENMFAPQQSGSPYGPSMFPFPNKQQSWPNRYAPNYQERNFGNNGQFYNQKDMNRPFFIPA